MWPSLANLLLVFYIVDQALANRLIAYRSNRDRVSQQLEYEQRNLIRLYGKVDQIEKDKLQLVKCLGLIDKAIAVISANGIGKIESIVSGGLKLVFEDPTLSFVVERKEGARGNSYRLYVKNRELMSNPMDSFGGGVVNVVAFLLRVIMIKRFKLAKFLVVDESFNNVSGEYLPKVSAMMKQLTAEHGYTILAITHQPILTAAADAVYRVSTDEARLVPQLTAVPRVADGEVQA